MAPLNPFAPEFISWSAPSNLMGTYYRPQQPHQIFTSPTTTTTNYSTYDHPYYNPNPSPFSCSCPSLPSPFPVVPTPTYYIYNVQPNYVMYYKFNKEQPSAAAEPTEPVVVIEEQAAKEENLIRREKDHTGGGGGSSSLFNKRRSFKKFKGQFQRKRDYEFRDGDVYSDQATTVMIKNVPAKFDKNKLLGILDDHCRRMNEKEKAKAEADALSAFDFLYLPMDFKTGCSLGYAFVNFTTPMAANRLYHELHHKSWANFGSHKVCEIKYARIQGLHRLLDHFSNSTFVCESEEYLPVHFMPSRDGSCLGTGQRSIGKYLPNWI